MSQSSFQCIFRKEGALKRHVEEISALEPRSWNIQWFIVENPLIPKEDQVEGIYIQATGDNWKQDRFIVITSNGTHQTIILHRPNTSQGEYASTLIQEAIRSMRTFNELYSGRAWINRDLEQIRLADLQSLPSEMRVARLAEIQSLLISRITVEPGSYDSYFHLAGTSMILAQSARSNLKGIEPGLGVIALKNLESSYRYALDINPADKRTTQLQSLMLESRKK